MNVAIIGNQRQVTIVAAVETCRRIATHDALQQHATGHLQTAALKKTFSRHYLAAGYTVEVRCDALDLINARQSFGEGALATGRHDTILNVVACR
ncbi:hypothetical protein D3C77_466810 [compost metagenome]